MNVHVNMQRLKDESLCIPSCKSVSPLEEVFIAIVRGNEDQAIAFMCWRCANYQGLVDSGGRTAMHIASALGKNKIISWLIEHDGDINHQDRDFGFTPLHRSVYHGQLEATRELIKHGAKLDILDNEGLTALDHIMRNKLRAKYYPDACLNITPWYGSSIPKNEVYVWGNNSNFNLGIGNDQIKRQPDTIDYFWRNKISIKRVAMGKFHSIFLSEDGRVFSCGLGQGGRLGLDSEETVMTPNEINFHPSKKSSTSSKLVVISASVGRDHTLLLTNGGEVYSFGSNEYYQLGLYPPPSSQLFPKALQIILRQPLGVSAARYHSAAWNLTDLYTWGYDCGQLGYRPQNGYQIVPKVVSNLRASTILAVASSDSAIVVVNDRGDVLLLKDHGVQRIGGITGLARGIQICGGRLDPTCIKSADVSGWGDYRTGEEDLKVLALVWEESSMFWQSSTGQFLKCCFMVGNQKLKVTDAALGINKLIVVTEEYEAYESDLRFSRVEDIPPTYFTPSQRSKDYMIVFHMRRIGLIYRATNAYCDPKGFNFAVTQVNPNFLCKSPTYPGSSGFESNLLSLLEDATETDKISDVVFKVAGYRIPAHRYILESNCPKLASLVSSETEQTKSTQTLNLEAAEEVDYPKNKKMVVVNLSDFHPILFKEILKYIYTGCFDYCTPENWSPKRDATYAYVLLSNQSVIKNYSLQEIENVDECSSKEHSTSNILESKDIDLSLYNRYINERSSFEYNPVIDARRTAKYLELYDLLNKLNKIVYNKKKGAVFWKNIQEELYFERQQIELNYRDFQYLCDAKIECSDGKVVNAHKCILTMRSRYFEAMFKGDWLEGNDEGKAYFPFPFDVLEPVLLYAYQDRMPSFEYVEDVSLICQILVAADHILMDGLKWMCEYALSHLLTLKNASEMYMLSENYNAFGLRNHCLNFIVPNIAPLLESRGLDNVQIDSFKRIVRAFNAVTPPSKGRPLGVTVFNPFAIPTIENLQYILEKYGIPSEEGMNENKCQPKKDGSDTPKKRKCGKKHKLKRSSIDECVEPEIMLSPDSSQSDDLGAKSETLNAGASADFVDEPQPSCSHHHLVEIACSFDSDSRSNDSTSTLYHSENRPNVTTNQRVALSPQIEREFPSLTGDTYQPSQSSAAKVPRYRMAKLSQKARKRLLASTSSAEEPQEIPPEPIAEQNPWKKIGNDTQDELCTGLEVISLSDIMNQERQSRPRPQRSSLRESFSEDNSSSPAPSTGAIRKWSTRSSNDDSKDRNEKSFEEIMADELKQKEITKKIMEKSLNLTQIEDKAIRELKLLYEKEYGFEECITVRRRSPAKASTPIWKICKSP